MTIPLSEPTLDLNMTAHSKWRRLTPLVLVAAVLAACGESTQPVEPTPHPTPVASLEITTSATFLMPGEQAQLTAVPRSAGGGVLVGRVVAWSSTDTTVLTVDELGLVRAKRSGGAQIRAVVEDVSQSLSLTVGDWPVDHVTLGPDSLVLDPGQGAQVSVHLYAPDGSELTGREVSLSSSNPAIADVSEAGWVVGVTAGLTWITAFTEGKSAAIPVRVTGDPVSTWTVVMKPTSLDLVVGQGVLVYADVVGVNGLPVPGARIDGWGSDDPTVASVTSTGIVRAVATGTTRIWARSGAAIGYTAVTVRPAPTGPVRVYRMKPISLDDPDYRLSAPVDTIDWTDPNTGVTTRALMFVNDVRLTLLISEGRYVQEFKALLYAVDDPRPLGQTGWMEHGALAYYWDGLGYALTPDGGAPEFYAYPRLGNELRVSQKVRKGEERPWHYRYEGS